MAILSILQYPDPRLGKKAKTVSDFDDALQNIIHDMFDTLLNTANCAGLAATQLDFKDPFRITVVYDYRQTMQPDKDQALCLINPEILHTQGELREPEGCMSVSGGIYEAVTRPSKIVVKAQDQQGKFFEITGEDYMAKLLSHEIDHLNGKIFIDYLSRLKRQRIDKKIAKYKRTVI